MACCVAGLHLPKIAAKIYIICERTKLGIDTELTRRAKSVETESKVLKYGEDNVRKFRKIGAVWALG